MFSWSKDTGGTLNTSFLAAYNLEADGADDKGGFNMTVLGTPSFSAGKNGNAVDGGASNTTKWLKYLNNIGQGSGAFSISCWANVTTAPSSGNDMTMAQEYDATSGVGYFLSYRNVAGTLKLEWKRDRAGVGNDVVSFTTTLTTGTWYHMVMRYDGSTMEMFVNGTSQGTVATSGSGNALVDMVDIMSGDRNGNNFWSGLVDAVYFWGKNLSATEVSDLYNGGTGSFYTQAVAATPKRTSNLLLMGVG